jgi:phosphate transport system protein
LFTSAVRAWSTRDLRLGAGLRKRDDAVDSLLRKLMETIMRLEGPDAVRVAIGSMLAGRALERIADHAVMMSERLRYMLTGDVKSLSSEVGP